MGKDIGKILSKGSAKQRAILITEEIARGKFFKEKLLSKTDFNLLMDSFKSSQEIKIYNQFRALDDDITTAITHLMATQYEVLHNASNLRGYILVWNSIENAELLVNSVLHEIKDPKERKRIATKGAKDIDLLFSKTEPDNEGYLEIKIDFLKDSYRDENGNLRGYTDKARKTKEYSLWFVMNNVKRQLEASIVKYLAWEKATLDYMDENGFNIKTYKEAIEKTGLSVRKKISWSKYYGENNGSTEEDRLTRTLQKYAICPKIDDLKIDEEQYIWYRTNFLDGGKYPEHLRGKLNKNLQ